LTQEIKNYKTQTDINEAINSSEKCRVLALGADELKSRCSCDVNNKYLPPFISEVKDGTPFVKYRNRVAKSELKNYFMKAVNFTIGQIFKKDIKVNNISDIEKSIIEFIGDDTNIGFNDDVDKKGSSLNQFAKSVFKSALVNPAAFVLVDSPSYEKTDKAIIVDGKTLPNSKETEKEFGLNPYFVNIPFINVISCLTNFDSKTGLNIEEFSFLDNKRLNSDGSYDYDIVTWTKDTISKISMVKGVEKALPESKNSLGFIPLSILVLGEKVTDYFGIAPLSDLADLNITHFQKQSEHNNMMGWVRQPTWHLSGLDKEWIKDNPIGCGTAVVTDNDGKMENVGIVATAESGSMDDLKHDEEYMESYTLSLLESGAVKTATATNAIVGSTTSSIRDWAQTFKDFLDDLYYNLLIVKQLNTNVLCDIFVNQEFSKPFDTETANFVQTAASAGRLSKETFLDIIKKWGMLPDDFDVKAELTRLDAEIPKITYLPTEGESKPQDAEDTI
jgi:hypothetical protein